MQNNPPIKLIIVGVILLFAIWWLWHTGDQRTASSAASTNLDQQEFVSAIQPIVGADAAIPASTVKPGTAPLTERDAEADAQINNRFHGATQSLGQGDSRTAIAELSLLIEKHPRHIEPYINLASIYASEGDLEEAREILIQGLNANNNYATLFTNLQKIQGAMAANAYQVALAEEGEAISTIELPLMDSIALSAADQQIEDLSNQLDSYQKRIEKSDKELKQLSDKLAKNQLELQSALAAVGSTATNTSVAEAEIATLQNQLSLALQRAATQQSNHELELANLQQQVQQQGNLQASFVDVQQQIEQYKKQLELSAAELQAVNSKLQEAQKQAQLAQQAAAENAANTEAAQSQIVLLQTQLDQAQKRLAAMQSDHQLEVAGLQRQLEAQNTLAASPQPVAAPTPNDTGIETARPDPIPQASRQQLVSAEQERQAIERVESWASAWSAQQVDDYISHYSSNYSPPGSGLSHAAWIEQRRIRLTNKSSIRVGVSNFKIKRLESQADGDKFAVIFLQHYRANTMDDKIRKSLSFSVSGDDWSQAKIVAEEVLR